ncbi:MAG: hypothetical protein J7501_12520 [Bdellovibrio sp.]|nr:hypothetical protein [Bdellovibrio sp.]
MKPLFILLSLSFALATLPAHAQVRCSARDKGWEEHWGGHEDCNSCMKKHGECVESCSLNYVTCEARGVDYLGNAISVKGAGNERYEAESNAVRLCQRNFQNCSVVNCTSEAENVSSRRCPKPEAPPAPTPAPAPNPTPAPNPNPGNGGPGHGGPRPGPGKPGGPGPHNAVENSERN